jgi:TonB-linked SusC/RagA family outer membrane protein
MLMKKFLILLICIMSFGMIQAQTVTLSGSVLSAVDNQPIPGVSIVVMGTTIGTSTSIDGEFSLDVPEASSTLMFSFVGMVTQTYDIDFANPSSIEVLMEEDFLNLEEIIVTGYSTRVKNSITGSTVQVKADEFKDIPVTSIDQTLQGKVAGLTISSTSGTPGSMQDIRIRGVGSITAGNDPLIVIDGVPVVNQDFSGSSDRTSLSALASINSNDVETITVLKDASATSAYGARGSNGVIVITTKKGRVGKTQFNLSAYYGFQNKASQGKDVLTGVQREKLYLDGVYNTYGVDEGFTREGAFDWALGQGFGGAALYDSWHADGSPEGNWEEAMRNKNAPVTNINLSASGGDQVSSFYASAGYNKTEATVVGNDFRRFTGTLNYNRNFHKRVKFSTANKVSNTHQNGLILEQSAYFANPHLSKYFMSPIFQATNEDGSAKIDNPSNLYNWLYLKDNDETTNNMTRAMTNNFLEWEIIDNLRFKTLLSLDYIMADYKNYQNRQYGDSSPENGTSFRSTEQNVNVVFQNSLAYDLNLNDHRLNFLALMEYQKNNRDYIFGYGENYSTDGLTNINQAGANWDAGSFFQDWMNLSYLGMVNYNFQGKYVADATYRREGSSKFAKDQRYGNFWSVGAAWNMSQEAFLGNAGWLNNLRIRASYGVSGNSDVGINQYQALLSYDADYADQGAVYPSRFGNSLLTWEKNKTMDVGFDFGVIEGRISGSFSYFNKETYDLLQDVPLTRTSGHANITQNVGTVVNKGIEGLLNFDIVRRSDFNISISTNFATLDNEVKELAVDANGEDINIETGTRKIEVGHPIYEWNMRKWAGVDPDNGDPLWYLDGIGGETTNDYNAAEKGYQGKSAIPSFSGGLALHIDFKGIYLDASVYGAGGHMVFEDWARYTHDNGLYTTDYFNGVADLSTSWFQPGDQTDYPRIYHGYNPNFASHTSSRFLYDGDYVRLKDLVLGYNLPASIVSKIRFSGIQIYVRGTNLYTWIKDDRLQYDPEVRADGFTYLTTPPIKSFIFGVNFNF